MTKVKETATERRAREAAETRAALEKWEREKPARLLQALAAATDLNMTARVYTHQDAMHYEFLLGDGYEDHFANPVAELSEWQMQCIEQRLAELLEVEIKRKRLSLIRKKVIERLSDEEREALGLA